MSPTHDHSSALNIKYQDSQSTHSARGQKRSIEDIIDENSTSLGSRERQKISEIEYPQANEGSEPTALATSPEPQEGISEESGISSQDNIAQPVAALEPSTHGESVTQAPSSQGVIVDDEMSRLVRVWQDQVQAAKDPGTVSGADAIPNLRASYQAMISRSDTLRAERNYPSLP